MQLLWAFSIKYNICTQMFPFAKPRPHKTIQKANVAEALLRLEKNQKSARLERTALEGGRVGCLRKMELFKSSLSYACAQAQMHLFHDTIPYPTDLNDCNQSSSSNIW